MPPQERLDAKALEYAAEKAAEAEESIIAMEREKEARASAEREKRAKVKEKKNSKVKVRDGVGSIRAVLDCSVLLQRVSCFGRSLMHRVPQAACVLCRFAFNALLTLSSDQRCAASFFPVRRFTVWLGCRLQLWSVPPSAQLLACRPWYRPTTSKHAC